MHLMSYGIVFENSGLRFAIRSSVVGEIASWAQDDLNGVTKYGRRKNFRHNVVPCGSRARQQYGRSLEPVFSSEFTRGLNSAFQEGANGGFVIENALINLDTAEDDGVAIAR